MNSSGEVKSTKGSLAGPWNKEKPTSSVRAPKVIPAEPPHVRMQQQSTSIDNNVDSLVEVLRTSTLNVNAQEFVPQWCQPQLPQIPNAEDMAYLKEAIDTLTLSPGRYPEFLPPIEDIVESIFRDDTALSRIIDVIIEQCIAEANFRYTGARLCSHLSLKFGAAFINNLLSKCCEKNMEMQALMGSDRSRVCGFGFLLAELYVQVTIGQSHIQVIANGLKQILEMLLSTAFTDTIKTVCQILKLCGATLESEEIDLQPVYTRLEQIRATPGVDDNTRFIIANVFQIRKTEVPTAMYAIAHAAAHAATVLTHPSEVYSDPVFYGPDGQIISEEESSFLNDNIPVSEDLDDYILEDTMNEEEQDAFDEFLAFSRSNQQSYRH